MTTLTAPAGVKAVSLLDGSTSLVAADGTVVVAASAAAALLGAGFVYPDQSVGTLKMRIAAGAGGASNIAVAGIKKADHVIGAVNLDDKTEIIVAAVKAEKGTLGGGYDGVLAAHTAGAAGNAITVRFVGDSPGAGGVTIVRTGTDFVIHYESGVSTQANVNTAIGNLAGGDDLVDVKTAGTGATVLSAPADNVAVTHLAGGADAYSELPTVTSDGNVQFAVSSTSGKTLLILYFVG